MEWQIAEAAVWRVFDISLGPAREVAFFATYLLRIGQQPNWPELVAGVLAPSCLRDSSGNSIPLILSCTSVSIPFGIHHSS